MGNLLRVLGDRSMGPKVDFFVDFERASPTQAEMGLYGRVNECIERMPGMLGEMKTYRGAGQEIREAISNSSSEEHQSRAWSAVCPLVLQLKSFYEFSNQLEGCVLELLRALSSTDMSPSQHLETQQALTKQFAEILHFSLSFDDLKMNNPAIQNDFSYYRRTKNRKKLEDQEVVVNGEVELPDDVGNRMSLFYANPTPMLNTLTSTTTKFTAQNDDVPLENTTDVLCTMAAVCRVMTENQDFASRFEHGDTALFCLRVMVGVIILYDHVHPMGAFVKTSNIDMRATVKLLKDHPLSSESLLNALRYNTKHLNDEATPKAIQQMLS